MVGTTPLAWTITIDVAFRIVLTSVLLAACIDAHATRRSEEAARAAEAAQRQDELNRLLSDTSALASVLEALRSLRVYTAEGIRDDIGFRELERSLAECEESLQAPWRVLYNLNPEFTTLTFDNRAGFVDEIDAAREEVEAKLTPLMEPMWDAIEKEVRAQRGRGI